MYLYQIERLVISETKWNVPFNDEKYHDKLREWQKNLIPVKEGEERKFMRLAQELIPNVPNVVLKATLNEALQNGIKMPDEAVDFRNECYKPHEPIKLFAYLNNQPKKEESNEAVEFGIWLTQNAYCVDGSWYLHEAMSGEMYSVKQLYLKFKQP